MLPSSFVPMSGCSRVVTRCSAQLVEAFGRDGRGLHQEISVHRLPSTANPTIQAAFFNPLLSHGRGIMTTLYPSKCSSVITSTYVSSENPGEFRIGIRAFYPQESNMKAQDASKQIQDIIDNLTIAQRVIDDNDTLTFDVDRKLNMMEELADEVSDYVDDLT